MSNPEVLQAPRKPEFLFNEEDWFKVTDISVSEEHQILAIEEPYFYEEVVSYVYNTPEGLIIFDTGFGLADIRKIIKKHASDNKPVKIFLTHSDWDHVGGLKDFAAEFPNVEVFIFNPTRRFAQVYGTDRLAQGWTLTEMGGLEPEHFSKGFKEKHPLPSQEKLNGFAIPGFLDASQIVFPEGEKTVTFNFFGLTIVAIKTPGHTPDSVCFFIRETGDLITGDTLYPGPEYLHMPSSDLAEYLASLELIQEIVGAEIKRILPGHNAPISKASLLEAHISALKGELEPISSRFDIDQFGQHFRINYVTKDNEVFGVMISLGSIALKHILQDIYFLYKDDTEFSWTEMLDGFIGVLRGTKIKLVPKLESEGTGHIVLDKISYPMLLLQEIADIHQMNIKADLKIFRQEFLDEMVQLKDQLDAMPKSEHIKRIGAIVAVKTRADNPWRGRGDLPYTSPDDSSTPPDIKE